MCITRLSTAFAIVFSLLFQFNTAFACEIVINEVMSSNASTIPDSDGDYEDWIEIANIGCDPVNLFGFGLSDDYGNPFRWVFPDTILQTGEYMLVWASGKNRSTPGEPLHTNFSISSAGEEILLTHPNGIRIDELPPTHIPTDMSYGRKPDGTESWQYFTEPTPGMPNTTEGFSEILSPPEFSSAGGFYPNDFQLSLLHPDEEVTIVFTLNGSIPDINNIEGTSYPYKNQYPQNPNNTFGDTLYHTFQSKIYHKPIYVYDKSAQANKLTNISSTIHAIPFYFPDSEVKKAFIVSAKAIKPGAVPSLAVTHTFFVISQAEFNPASLPIVSLVTQETHLFDYEKGIYVAGIDFDQWRLDNPDDPWPWDRPGNYFRRGVDWEYLASFEYIEPEFAESSLNQNIGFRIHGGATRQLMAKSLRLYARNLYGNSHFEHSFFPDYSFNSFKRLILRNSGNDFTETMFRDAAIQGILKNLNFETQAYQPLLLFINGEYWGIHNMRERYDKHYLERVYGIDPENLDILENNAVVKEGDAVHYNELLEFISSNNISEAEPYQYIKTQLDVDNFTDYYIAQIFSRNTDWPQNNVDFWRLKTSSNNPDAPKGHDGRWRWLLYDMDFGFGFTGEDAHTDNMFEYLSDNHTGHHAPLWSTFLYRNLLTNDSFRLSFINRFADLLNTTFLPERMTTIITEMKEKIEPEMPSHIHRWSRPMSISDWEENVDIMLDFANERPYYQRQHLREYFDLGDDVIITLNVNSQEKGFIRINSIKVTQDTDGVTSEVYPWSGSYFSELPIEVEAIPNEGYLFSHWEGSDTGNNALLNIVPSGTNVDLKAHFVETDQVNEELLYFWLFDGNMQNNTPFESLNATYSISTFGSIDFHSALDGYPFNEDHPNWRKASMERRNSPTNINYRPEGNSQIPFEAAGMRGLQIKQPFTGDGGENTMVFSLPTVSYSNLIFSFAAKDENAADALMIDYSVSSAEPIWTDEGLEDIIYVLNSDYQLFEIDFSNIPAVNNNPDFKIRIRFTGSNMDADNGDRVTFNNISLDGTLALTPDAYYCKPSGDLNVLETWGSEPDGSGISPQGFNLENATFYIHNREEAIVNYNWSVTGSGARVVLGDGANTTKLVIDAELDAVLQVSNNAKLTLRHPHYPVLEQLDSGSTIMFTNNATLIPYLTYHNIIIENVDPVFPGDGTVFIHGNTTLNGIVSMPDARNANTAYNILFAGNAEQEIVTNGNVLRAYNMDFIKASGSISFADNSIISSDNQLSFTFDGNASLFDNGIMMYAGNSVNIAGDGDAYNFTGTLVLAGTEEGIVKGAGDGNNFNIREGDNANMVASLNNIIVRARNTDGQFRFRDGTSNMFTIKGDLIVEPEVEGRIRFYDNKVLLGGNLFIDSGFSGSLDPIDKLSLTGSVSQTLHTEDHLTINQMNVANTNGVLIANGTIQIKNFIDLHGGFVKVKEGGLIVLEEDGFVLNASAESFIDGALAYSVESLQQHHLHFPIGINDIYLPFDFSFNKATDHQELAIGRIIADHDVKNDLPESLELILDQHLYAINFDHDTEIQNAEISIFFNDINLGFDPSLLRVAKYLNNMWQDMGGLVEGNSITASVPVSDSGLFALAKSTDNDTIPKVLNLFDINIEAGVDTCFAATETIVLCGGGTGFVLHEDGTTVLISGHNIIMHPNTIIKQGSYLHAYIAPGGPFCNIEKQHFLEADHSEADKKSSELLLSNAFGELHNAMTQDLFQVYPNPTSDLLTVEVVSDNQNLPTKVELFGFMGETLISLKDHEATIYELDMRSFPSGLYFVRVNRGNQTQTKRIVKK